MRIFLNAGFGEPIGQPTLDYIAGLGFRGVRQDVLSLDSVGLLVDEFAGRTDLTPIFIADYAGYTAEIAQAIVRQAAGRMPNGYMVEIGNELNIAGKNRGPIDPDTYAKAYAEIEAACVSIDPRTNICTAGVFGVSQGAIDWVRRACALALPTTFVGYHPYREKNWYTPGTAWSGCKTRAEELIKLKNAAQGRRLVCSEVGWHTAPERSGWWIFGKTHQLTDPQVLGYLQQEASVNSPACGIMVVYQLNDGPDPKNGQDRFGIRTMAGNTKMQALIGRWEG